MLSALAFACLLAQVRPPLDMSSRYDVVDPNRLALTPMIDGRFDNEEWDVLHSSPTAPVFLQWEPGTLYLGGKFPVGKDVVFSLDMQGDGWLIGRDNVEVRVVWADGAPKVSARMLDAENRNAPAWIFSPFVEAGIRSAGQLTPEGWNLEMAIQSVDLPPAVLGRTIGIRADVLDPIDVTVEPYLPRRTSVVALRWERSRGLFSGMEWEPEYKVRSVTPGDSIRIRMNFLNRGSTIPLRAQMRTEGFGDGVTKALTIPFPSFDRKGRAFLDYETEVGRTATRGYRVLRVNFNNEEGKEAIIQTSYKVADSVDIEPTLPGDLVMVPDSRIIRGEVVLRSNTSRRVSGNLEIVPPENWSVAKFKANRFTIYHSRSQMKAPFELIVPQNARGLFSLRFNVTIGDQKFTRIAQLAIR